MYSDPVPFHRPGSSQWSPNQQRSPKTVIKSTITEFGFLGAQHGGFSLETEWPRLMQWVTSTPSRASSPT
ncbi:hypothetical protein HU200_016254 [Digitaria exilis]|uniref:Uncharacterized protein n=1 Tax=Digitaria exilis TaxID=1010633 RepID=A0A835F9H7_9POAL|nr:hypothetical protein HU200_016254 [Digitaria exilis]